MIYDHAIFLKVTLHSKNDIIIYCGGYSISGEEVYIYMYHIYEIQYIYIYIFIDINLILRHQSSREHHFLNTWHCCYMNEQG